MAGTWRAKVVLPPHVVLGPGPRRIHALIEVSNPDEGEDLAVSLNLTRRDVPPFSHDQGLLLPPLAQEAARQLWDWFLTADGGTERKKLHALRKTH